MKRKNELSTASSSEHLQEQVVNCLIGDNLVDSFGNDVKEVKNKILSYLTEEELNKAHNLVALTCKKQFGLFKPNFKMELVHKLLTTVAMGEQYDFSAQVLTQEPSELDKKEVMEKRKILFISMNNKFQMCYCTDDWKYVQTDVKDETIQASLQLYKESPLVNENALLPIESFLTHLGIRTRQDKAERLLKASPELMLEKITFTDCSGRTFSNISAFEFILWALDTRYMFNMMLNCLPQDKSGLTIAKKLQEQYDYHEKQGVTYSLPDGQIIKENHFDFSVLINALQAYVDNFNEWDLKELKKHWCTLVGKAQCIVPAHVMQHYFDNYEKFYPLPKFKAEQFNRTLIFDTYYEKMSWRGATTGGSDFFLGIDFGFSCGGSWIGWYGDASSLCEVHIAGADLAAVNALCKVRTADYRAIPSKLASFQKKVSIDETSIKVMSS